MSMLPLHLQGTEVQGAFFFPFLAFERLQKSGFSVLPSVRMRMRIL